MEDLENYRGVSWYNHGRLVEYDFGGEPLIQQWLISNPNRVNLGRVGLIFLSSRGQRLNITESDLTNVSQSLDLWSGIITSKFSFAAVPVTIETSCAQSEDTIGVKINSPLIQQGKLGVFLDFPWNDGSAKFQAPFVGSFDASLAANHTTILSTRSTGSIRAEIRHTLDTATFSTSVGGDGFTISRDTPTLHRYSLVPQTRASTFSLSLHYGRDSPSSILAPSAVRSSSSTSWAKFWSETGFLDVAQGSTDPRAEELQRRIILSRYLARVNEAGNTPAQESGLVNNGWYGKFHMEQYFWHSAHWALWNDWDLLRRSSDIYSNFLPSSIQRAQVQQGWPSGARWPKMTDPSGRSAPGEINNLLIWQQPHPLVFAQYEYRAFPFRSTLTKWKNVVRETANWMAAFAWHNSTTKVYDLGPPMYVVSEDTSPNITQNPAFELAYWRLGLGLAEDWMAKLGEEVPQSWTTVKNNLAPLPLDNGTYIVYEGLEPNFWTDPAYINDHPALVGLHGWLPPTDGLNLEVAKVTAEKVWVTWNISNCWGWDFPMLAMSAARNGEPTKAIDWLLHPLFEFDDVGQPIGGVRVPTPYFPGSSSLLYAISFMAAGWDGSTGFAPGFPSSGWNVRWEGLAKAL